MRIVVEGVDPEGTVVFGVKAAFGAAEAFRVRVASVEAAFVGAEDSQAVVSPEAVSPEEDSREEGFLVVGSPAADSAVSPAAAFRAADSTRRICCAGWTRITTG
jgi:hypothetical protein